MKNFLMTLILALNLMSIHSQTTAFSAPDYAAIQKEVGDPASSYYYPRLLERYQTLDTSLKAPDYKYLYYGYVFQKEYKPYEVIPELKELISYMNRFNSLTPVEIDKLIELGNKCRAKFPFNTDVAKYLWMAYQIKKDYSTGLKMSLQAYNILNTIQNSGDGKTQETAYHVLTIGNEYELMRRLFVELESQSLVGRNFDYIKLKKNKDNLEGIYFNIERMFKTLSN